MKYVLYDQNEAIFKQWKHTGWTFKISLKCTTANILYAVSKLLQPLAFKI